MTKLCRPTVEIDLVQHCNLRCAGCNHASPHLDPEFLDFESFRQDIEALAQVMSVSELRFLGGEPLLHPEIDRFLAYASSSSFCDSVSIITNGLLLPKMSESMWRHTDLVVVSRYPGVRLPSPMSEIAAIGTRFNTKVVERQKDYFQMGLINSTHRDESLVRRIFETCKVAHVWQCHTVHNGWYYKCALPIFNAERLRKRGGEIDSRLTDGVWVRDNPRLLEQLVNYLADTMPMKACWNCLGSTGRDFPVRQMNKLDIAAELAEDHSDVRCKNEQVA